MKTQVRNPKSPAVEKTIIPVKYQHHFVIAIIYVCLLLFFHTIVFEGKTYISGDTAAANSWSTLLKDAETDGIFPLWNPYIFCGMPGYASLTFSGPRPFDLTTFIFSKVRILFSYLFLEQKNGSYLVFYFIFGIGMYLLAYQRFKNKPVALCVSLMATYATYVAILIMIGHFTKIAVLAWFPYVFLLAEKLREKFNLLQVLLLIIITRLMIEPGHVQFIFYIYLALGTYLLFLLLRALIKKENWRGILISGTSLIFATAFAFIMGADQHFSTLEYNPFSIRGSNPIMHTSAISQTKTIEGGLDYDYATNWSFGPGEIMTFFIPSWYGFGSHPYQGPLTQNRETHLETYWGPQMSVDGPQYMGIVVIVLAIIGFIRNRKEPFVQYMGAAIIVSLFIAFGREFSLIYDLMYRYFPMFNKFRVPIMILMLVQFFIPILAGYGIMSFISEQKKHISPIQEKWWKYSLGGLILAIIVTLIGKDFIKDIHSSFFPLQHIGNGLARYYGQLSPEILGKMYDFVFDSIITDIIVGCVLLIIVFGGFYYYQKGKLKSATLYSLLVITILIDLWRVAWKPSDPRNPQETSQAIVTPDFVKVIHQDTTLFRVLRIQDGQPIYDNSLAYWRIQNAYGYQGAKLRIYQDMIDVATIGNPLVWQLMNIKYLISNRDESNAGLIPVYNGRDMKVYAFRSWLPRVFFVKKYEVSNGRGTLNKIAALSFDPLDIAYTSDSIKANIDPPLQGALAEVTHYGIHDLEVNVTATGNNLLFLSETYYPKGWKAFIDEKETEILQLNYLFRGVIVSQGQHTLKMKFEPQSFYIGRQISLISNIIVFLGIAFQGVRLFRKKGTTSQ